MSPKDTQKDVYTGLKPNFRLGCEALCLKLSSKTWDNKKWAELSFTANGETKHFPGDGDANQKVAFLDEYLYTRLAPLKLNKYRGWMLHRLLKQMDLKPKDPAYLLPEDIGRLVTDITVFRNRVRNVDINQCKTLGAFVEAIKSFRPKHPLVPEEQWQLHARYLETDTVADLQRLLPENWKARLNSVRQPDGTLVKREGGARLMKTLDDGTLVIQLLTKDAARDYGSPDWCTSYRNEDTYFKDYKDDLYMILSPHGERWQIHLRTAQWKDDTDNDIDFPAFLKEYKGLAEFLLPSLQRSFRVDVDMAFGEKTSNPFTTEDLLMKWSKVQKISRIPEWTSHLDEYIEKSSKQIGHLFAAAIKEHDDQSLDMIIDDIKDPVWTAHLSKVFSSFVERDTLSILRVAKRMDEWRNQVTPHIASAFVKAASLDEWEMQDAFAEIASDPVWRQEASTRVGKAFLTVFDRNYYDDDKGEDFVRSIAKVPEWKDVLSKRLKGVFKNLLARRGEKAILYVNDCLYMVPEWQHEWNAIHSDHCHEVSRKKILAKRQLSSPQPRQ